MSYTVAIGSLFIECNHFGGVPADLETFRRTQLDFGEAILEYDSGTVGGMLQTLQHRNVVIRPLLSATACPSRPLTSDCYQTLKDDLLRRLAESLPVEGILLALHGSAAADNAGDLEGDLLEAVRQLAGDSVPIVATLDLHAHVTQAMITNADALLAWETYPHRDAWETGERGATALLDILDGHLLPTMAMAKAPVIVSGVHGGTEGPGPFADVMRFAKSLEERDDVYSTGAFLVHPYLDLPDMGGGGLVITNDSMPLAKDLATSIADAYWQKRFDLEPDVFPPVDAIRRGLDAEGLVVLVETSDCCGGGAAGDSVHTLKVLLAEARDLVSYVPVVDPDAARVCHQAGEGHDVTLHLGHALDQKWGTPVEISGTIVTLSDGRFRYTGGIWDGVEGNMGQSAVLRIDGVHVLIASHGTYEWCGEQFEAVGLDAANARFVVAKNPMNYSLAYGDKASAMYMLDTPGPTPPTLKGADFRQLQRPFFPRDADIADWRPVVLS